MSLDTKNELLDLAAQRLGNIPAKHVLTPEGIENNKVCVFDNQNPKIVKMY